MSPISDTTVLSALACDCKLLDHVSTQAPYAFVVVVISMILGTIPIGYGDNWPNIVGILLGTAAVIAFVYGLCVPVLSPTGRYDIFTELYLKFVTSQGKESELFQLIEDTTKYCAGGELVEEADEKYVEEAGDEKAKDLDGGEEGVVMSA
jgi:hypothetical protein